MTTVWVVSYVYWNKYEYGYDYGGGGFLWNTDRDRAVKQFYSERDAWQGSPHRIKLVRVNLPFVCDTNISSDNSAWYRINEWLERHTDDLEDVWLSEKVAISA